MEVENYGELGLDEGLVATDHWISPGDPNSKSTQYLPGHRSVPSWTILDARGSLRYQEEVDTIGVRPFPLAM